ncbi:MAG: family 43 glycosylhydrolase [Bacteroidales bacterium]|nr:family 43 glycosylhydrolase [Bacteroidales bacterium]
METDTNTGNGFFLNPILGGDYPDPSVLRVDSDFYMTHSSFNYCPGLLIWHSTDLVNWERISYALNRYVGSVWAPDFIKSGDTYYIYFPAGGTNWVVTALSPEGPWSDPINLNLPGFIDPGHVADKDGNRYLYLSKGYIIRLAEDGLSTLGDPEFIYEGWKFPESWSTECFCLESPKSTVKDDFFHLLVAEGGTAGPATSHMVVSARSKSLYGPFENSPYNPIVHTESRTERWWSQGHGTLVDDMDGNWWILYHGYENGFHTLGRQTLMLPVEWTEDQWFRIPEGVKSSDSIKAPAGNISGFDEGLSDDFEDQKPGLQWQFYKHFNPDRVILNNGKMVLRALGNSFAESSPILVNSSDRHYEVQVEYTIEEDTKAGLCLFYHETAQVRIEADVEKFTVYNQGKAKISAKNIFGDHGFLRIINHANEVSFYYSADGETWVKLERSIETSGFNHNVFGEFLSLRVGIYAFGNGKVKYDNFIYKKL